MNKLVYKWIDQQKDWRISKVMNVYEKPIFFERNRIFRIYKGGLLFHNFFGDVAEDGNYPEEWIASCVRAMNLHSDNEKEGISRIKGTELYLDDILKQHPQEILGDCPKWDILVKMLDSGIRLPMQCHPDRAFSQQYFNSEYGKAELWIVIATRENAKLFIGFNQKIDQATFTRLVEQSLIEKECMTKYVNELSVKKGDVYLIPPRTIHAIGYGCLILEVQEPSDWSICPEHWCGDRKSDAYEMYMDLEPEIALKCFDYTFYGDKPINLAKKTPRTQEQTPQTLRQIVVDKEDTPFFAVNRLELNNGSLSLTDAPAVYVITEGKGVLTTGKGYEESVSKGDYFLLPHYLKNQCRILSKGHLEAYVCMPSI